MQRIPIKLASAGMILANPVSREDGMVLAGEGVILTDPIIDRFKSSNVSSLAVKGRPLPDLPSGLDLNVVRDRMPYLFRKYQNDQLMLTMQNMLIQYLNKAILAQEAAQRAEMSGQLSDEGGA